MWDPLFYNNATVSVAFPTPLAWRFLSSTISFNVGSSAANRAFRCFAHTITAGLMAAITSAKTARESKGRWCAATRERSGSVPSSCGERQRSGSLLCRGISASHLHFAAHAEISPPQIYLLQCLFCSPSIIWAARGGARSRKTDNLRFMRCTRGWGQGMWRRSCRELSGGQGQGGEGEGNRGIGQCWWGGGSRGERRPAWSFVNEAFVSRAWV